MEVLVATVRHALADNVPTLAGALTYYALLSLFPALIVFLLWLWIFNIAAPRGAAG
ncbi:MAG: hypothetical protein V2J16_05110 [Thermoleophilia bacterium]|nr:hypothetical protein [Thermoleophilia bacterium]